MGDDSNFSSFNYSQYYGRAIGGAHATQGQTTYDWDDRGYLIQVTRPGTIITYTYDALGQRKTKTVNGVTTRYVTAPIFGMSHLLMELDGNNGIQRTYFYGGNQQRSAAATAR